MPLTSQVLKNCFPFFRFFRKPSAREGTGSPNGLSEPHFVNALALERKRSQRSGKPFLLLLLDMSRARESSDVGKLAYTAMRAIDSFIRDTDFLGWYNFGLVVGLILTELGDASSQEVQASVQQRVSELLSEALGEEDFAKMFFSFHFFPEEHAERLPVVDLKLYPDYSRSYGRGGAPAAKRAVDIVGSILEAEHGPQSGGDRRLPVDAPGGL